jgi:hypothetical protein
MESEISSFYKDKKFSEKEEFKKSFDEFYNSDYFKWKLQKLRKKGKVEIVSIDRSNNPLFQKITNLDAIIQLSTGSALLIDEKIGRFFNDGKFAVEVVSNPNGKRDGWGYHIGLTIVHAISNKEQNGFITRPIVYMISEKFINDIVRNNTYTIRFNKSTNGLYRSMFKWIPYDVLEQYW